MPCLALPDLAGGCKGRASHFVAGLQCRQGAAPGRLAVELRTSTPAVIGLVAGLAKVVLLHQPTQPACHGRLLSTKAPGPVFWASARGPYGSDRVARKRLWNTGACLPHTQERATKSTPSAVVTGRAV
eukprot:176475-Chlamydomonas_euryale.AAC.4